MEYQHWRVDAHLVKVFIDKSASTIDWLEKMGVEFVGVESYFPGGYLTQHVVKPEQLYEIYLPPAELHALQRLSRPTEATRKRHHLPQD